jgi:hypothetical protein
MVVALLSHCLVLAQKVGIGQWREHLPYKETRAISVTKNKVYCAAVSTVFYYDKEDQSLNRLSTVNGLSDVDISTLKYNEKTGVLLIAYRNGNIDLLLNSGEIINVSFIKKSDLVGNKTIFRIDQEEEFAFLSCGFGIVVFDTKRKEISDTYFVGEEGNKLSVLDIALSEDTIYAATEQGLYKGPRNRNLADYRSWIREKALPKRMFTLISQFNHGLIINERGSDFTTDTIYQTLPGQPWQQIEQLGDTGLITNYDFEVADQQLIISQGFGMLVLDSNLATLLKIFIYGEEGLPEPRQVAKDGDWYWVADNREGMVKLADNYRVEVYGINSPVSDRVFDIESTDGHVWSTAGGYSANFRNTFYFPVLNHFEEEEWNSVSRQTQAGLDSVYDLVSVAIEPSDPTHVFAASWGRGLLELKDGELIKVFDRNNTTEHSLTPREVDNATFIGGLDFDEFSNLWISNPFSTRLLSVRNPAGEWKSFNLAGIYDPDAVVAELMVDRNSNVWMIQHRDGRIIVYNFNGTPMEEEDDPEPVALIGAEGSGNLQGDRIYCTVEDRNGEVWIGSNKGVVVIFNPSAIFNGGDYDAQQIQIQQDGTTQNLLETEAVTAIAVDGANRKWLGTQNAGVFLMAADGTKEINHFTTDNSPLLSNNVHSISIEEESGEVFIGTEKGLISYRGSAVEPKDKIGKVEVFPNPVHPGYSGLIAIKGVVANSTVKITDAKGTLVYETVSLGGQAVWNGKNFEGNRVKTGVYLIFSTNDEGEETDVSKVMILN